MVKKKKEEPAKREVTVYTKAEIVKRYCSGSTIKDLTKYLAEAERMQKCAAKEIVEEEIMKYHRKMVREDKAV